MRAGLGLRCLCFPLQSPHGKGNPSQHTSSHTHPYHAHTRAVTLYFFGWAERPFVANRPYNVEKTLHNIFWSVSGVAMWVAFENVFAFLWATGRLAYMSDAEAFASPAGIARFVAGLMLTPIWRDFHFYVRGRRQASMWRPDVSASPRPQNHSAPPTHAPAVCASSLAL